MRSWIICLYFLAEGVLLQPHGDFDAISCQKSRPWSDRRQNNRDVVLQDRFDPPWQWIYGEGGSCFPWDGLGRPLQFWPYFRVERVGRQGAAYILPSSELGCLRIELGFRRRFSA